MGVMNPLTSMHPPAATVRGELERALHPGSGTSSTGIEAKQRRQPLQHDQAARIARIQAASTGGVCPGIRRVAGCATPAGSAGHAGAMGNIKLTFHLDHSAGLITP
jgi:hypothetical protein